jgi:multidrug efflux pump
MTITLAAVYTPLGIQGGLTGSLFREFAFTLAGAVIVSGVVALTLSPMMGSRLLRAGDNEKGFAKFVNHQFDVVRQNYMRLAAGTVQNRAMVVVLWVIVVLLMVPFYMFSQRELSPAEDQSVVFAIVQAAPNATLDQTQLFASQVYDVFHSFPETKNIFQITFPSGGFAGMVTKPWSERKKSTAQLQQQVSGAFSKIPGIRAIALVSPSLPGGGGYPVDFVIASTAEPEQLVAFANQLVQKAYASGKFYYVDTDLKFDQPQAEVVFAATKVRTRCGSRQGRARPVTMLGSSFVNRFSIQGRSYKGFPQIQPERSAADQLQQLTSV